MVALAEARAEHAAGRVPDDILDRCRRAEAGFAAAVARDDYSRRTAGRGGILSRWFTGMR
jgi:hypothetical protein